MGSAEKTPPPPEAPNGHGNVGNGGDGLPSYRAVDDQETLAPPAPLPSLKVPADLADTMLMRDNSAVAVTQDLCLAHLKLLHAIHNLKEDVGYTDGLWGLWDSQVMDGKGLSPELAQYLPAGADREKMTDDDIQKMLLSKVREKRWAIFVARAVDRYETWWNTQGISMLTEEDMVATTSDRYMRFPSTNIKLDWKMPMLPPLDVLMVMHTHMLNPRVFLEDTMRYGLSAYWAAGMPWHVINEAIGDDLYYRVSDDVRANWVAKTGLSWDNQEDPLTKALKCPYCPVTYDVPWTTCGKDEKANTYKSNDLIGEGYGDGQFSYVCMSCGQHNYKELLSVSKFLKDTTLLLNNSVPMPGTILNPQKGRPEAEVRAADSDNFARTFPNRMIRKVLRIQIMELIQPGGGHPHPTMDTVRFLIEQVTKDKSAVRGIDEIPAHRRTYDMQRNARLATRKMMSRYWGNFSPFSLDLCGAIMRQGSFIDKMVNLDWLHSPSAKPTMSRLITKYQRFLFLMFGHPMNTVVPTLDVDLAWHTHQLSPQAYYIHTVRKMGKFVDHDDKIDEGKLSEAFAFTTKVYQEFYGEVYSECTCWYCETIRSSQVSSMGALFKTKDAKVGEKFHSSGAAKLCPPDNSAHISAHNAVRFAGAESVIERARRQRHEQKLEENYQKARKRAAKNGRELPPRDEYYTYWGSSYYIYGPWMYPIWFTGGMYYGGGFGDVGAAGTCAAGTCGSVGVAVGACGAVGGCSNAAGGCTAGGCSSGGACGGAAGGIGGCSGGGGGCGGGGGGGGGGCGGGGGGGCGGGGGS